MKGERVREFFNSEAKALLALYKNIETLIPSTSQNGSSNVAEEGRYIESILRSFLNKHLPKGLQAFSGFIMRPATKFGNHDRSRRNNETDRHSTQLDIIIYDYENYPVYERFEEFVIVPPEGVIGIVSVKKNLYADQIAHELKNLCNAAELCNIKHKDEIIRGPSTCLISFSNKMKATMGFDKQCAFIFEKICAAYSGKSFDQCIGQIIVIDSFSIFKKRPNDEESFDNKAKYVKLEHSEDRLLHFGLQYLLTGVLSAYYHKSRNNHLRPGFTSFPTHDKREMELGDIDVIGLR